MTLPEIYENTVYLLWNDDYIVLCGGDGTLNRFVNDTENTNMGNEILYFPSGSGNDFARDLGQNPGETPSSIKE